MRGVCNDCCLCMCDCVCYCLFVCFCMHVYVCNCLIINDMGVCRCTRKRLCLF